MEPERPIEKLLRAFARKRRDQAGAPPELHPAMRRQLQDEVARRARKSGGGNFLTMLFAQLRPRLAFVLCVVGIALVGAWLMLPALNSAKSKSSRQLARGASSSTEDRRNQPATPPAESFEETTSALKREQTKTRDADAESQQRRELSDVALLGDDKKQLPARTAEGLAKNSEEKETDSVSNSNFYLSRTRTGLEVSAALSVMTTNAVSLAANEPAAEPRRFDAGTIPRAGGYVGGGGGGGGGNPNAVQFHRVPAAPAAPATVSPAQSQSAVVYSDRPASTSVGSNAALLVSFAMEQNGRELRVMDGDGSVYHGYVQTEESRAARLPAPEKAKTDTAQVTPALDQNGRAKESARGAATNWFFRVSGTNLSLKQNIVFSGNLVSTNAIQPGQPPSAISFGGAQPPNGSVPQLLLWDCQINGTALIENTSKVEIHAAPR